MTVTDVTSTITVTSTPSSSIPEWVVIIFACIGGLLILIVVVVLVVIVVYIVIRIRKCGNALVTVWTIIIIMQYNK